MQRLNAPTFFDQAIPLHGSSALMRNILLVLLGSLLLAISAQIKVPLWPVPVTLQTLVLMVLGATFGWRLAGLTVLAYWLEGIAGLPVFASGAGAAYFFYVSPTAGFLWGFLPAALFIGAAAQWGLARNPIMLAGAMLIAHVILYIPGLAWGNTFVGKVAWMAEGELLAKFLYPFVIGDLTKIIIAVVLVPLAYQAVERFKKS